MTVSEKAFGSQFPICPHVLIRLVQIGKIYYELWFLLAQFARLSGKGELNQRKNVVSGTFPCVIKKVA